MNVLVIGRGVPDKKNPMNGVFEFDQARALAKSGVKVTYFAIDLRSLRRKRKIGINTGTQDGVQWFSFNIPVGAISKKIRRKISTWALKKLYSRVYYEAQPDIIHAHFYDQAFSAAKLVENVNVPLIITEHSSMMNKDEVSYDTLQTASFAYSRAFTVIAVGKSLAENIKEKTGFSSVIVPNILGEKAFFKSERKKHSEYFGFVFAGNLIERKRPIQLVEAFHDVHETNPNVRLGLIGSGALSDEIKECIDRLKLNGCVKLYGRLSRDKIAETYSNYDCFVLPSANETFGVVYIEALAAGIPVIATACGGPEDFLTSELGIMIPIDNKEALVKAMETMIKSAGRYESNRLRTYVQERFSEQAVTKQLKSIYYDCVLKNGKSNC